MNRFYAWMLLCIVTGRAISNPLAIANGERSSSALPAATNSCGSDDGSVVDLAQISDLMNLFTRESGGNDLFPITNSILPPALPANTTDGKDNGTSDSGSNNPDTRSLFPVDSGNPALRKRWPGIPLACVSFPSLLTETTQRLYR